MTKQKRVLSNLQEVELLEKAPGFLRRGRRSASQSAGLHYERKVAEYFAAYFSEAGAIHGPWLNFKDDTGKGWCQPDLFLLPPHRPDVLWVGECKLKASKHAEERLTNMYIPCASILYPDHTIVGVQFCRHLHNRTKSIHQKNLISYDDLLDMEEYDKPFYTVNLRRVY